MVIGTPQPTEILRRIDMYNWNKNKPFISNEFLFIFKSRSSLEDAKITLLSSVYFWWESFWIAARISLEKVNL